MVNTMLCFARDLPDSLPIFYLSGYGHGFKKLQELFNRYPTYWKQFKNNEKEIYNVDYIKFIKNDSYCLEICIEEFKQKLSNNFTPPVYILKDIKTSTFTGHKWYYFDNDAGILLLCTESTS